MAFHNPNTFNTENGPKSGGIVIISGKVNPDKGNLELLAENWNVS